MTILELFMIILTVSLTIEMLVIAGCIAYMANEIPNFFDTIDSIRMWIREVERDTDQIASHIGCHIMSIDDSLNRIAHKDDIADEILKEVNEEYDNSGD